MVIAGGLAYRVQRCDRAASRKHRVRAKRAQKRVPLDRLSRGDRCFVLQVNHHTLFLFLFVLVFLVVPTLTVVAGAIVGLLASPGGGTTLHTHASLRALAVGQRSNGTSAGST